MPSNRVFKAPKLLEIEKALGTFDDNRIKSLFTKDFCETFDALPEPKSTDWLAQYPEKGQTYMEYVQLSRTLHTQSSSHRKTIYLTQFGQLDKSIFDIDSLIDYTHRFFQMEVKLIDPFHNIQWNEDKSQWICTMSLTNGKIRSFNLRTRYNEENKHSQICVTSILNLLKKVVPNDARCLVGLTMFDLYGDDTDLFISGLSMANCRVAAFSFYRYDPCLTFTQSDWFDCQLNISTKSKKQITQRQKLILLRACRLLTHEICHLLGLAHCIFYSCLLNGSANLDEDFSQPLIECPIDLRKLFTLINFNIYQRYEQLFEFFKLHEFINEMKMIEIKVNVLKYSIECSSSNCLIDTNSSQSTNIRKRKRTSKITTLEQDEQTFQSSPKHLKHQ